MSNPESPRVYKILSAADWHTAQSLGRTQTALDTADGYVHLSPREQVAETLALHYRGQSGVRLLEYALTDLGDVRWEASRGGDLFPHLYGPLALSAALRIWTLTTTLNATPALPEDIDA